jgi:hypothetical protein
MYSSSLDSLGSMQTLFEDKLSGATFSNDRKYRYELWRIWDEAKPLVMFIGLNPSTANETEADPTIESVTRISRFNGYGGFYMMNCWAYIATKPEDLKINPMSEQINNDLLTINASKCKDVVCAWGNFKIVHDLGRDEELKAMFPRALCIGRNQNGSPKHPLFQKGETLLSDFYDPTCTHPKEHRLRDGFGFHFCSACDTLL